MPRAELLQRIAALQREGVPFALATVVARKAPVSSHLGDAAIVFQDGKIEGYIGGGCSQEILRTQALEALRTGEPRLVRISPDAIPGLPGYPDADADAGEHYVRVNMTCASQGALDLYVEPYAALPALIVIGAMPIADATAQAAKFAGFEVLHVRDPDETENADAQIGLSPEALAGPLDSLPAKFRNRRVFGVVASMGEYDDVGLDALLRAKASYIALVASRPRSAAVLDALKSRGWSDENLAVIHNPAGLDINAKTAPEVALSIVAEMIRERRTSKVTLLDDTVKTATDPICGMQVTIENARHTVRLGAMKHYFCSVGCKRAFVSAKVKT
jgi:xanthine dehydrogenase accessory factor